MGALAVRKRAFQVVAVPLMVLALLCGGCTPSSDDLRQSREHVDSVMAILTRVQENLGRIQQKEAVVERLSSDIERRAGAKRREDIGQDISASIRFIDSTLEASRNLVAQLEKENRESRFRLESVDQLTAELRSTIERKDQEIRRLKGEVQMLDEQVADLLETVDVLDEFILEQEGKLSYAYYISGSYDELVRKGVLVRSGNPLSGIFSQEYRLADDFDVSLFQRIDIMETRDLFFEEPPRQLRIVTPHTAGSYEMVGGDRSSLLLINDESEFWKKSRCLVIVVEN
ncbi:MAG: biogenesis of lysosome-related organelles complex 1 subunit 2 [Prosthecochloris sp.]|nr:biogenesis of lysosome-related organelles complex 1 subunit 2 [Prosthecochloris sp.]